MKLFRFNARRPVSGTFLILMLIALGCASTNKHKPQLPGVVKDLDTIQDERGEVLLVTRDYVDVLKLDGMDVRRRYQYGWNYSRGVAQLRTFSAEGQALSTEDKPALSLVATDAEKAYAYSVIRSDPRWSSLYRDDSTFYGGFIFRPREHAVCGARSRCIHVFASDTDGLNTTMHLIFDLMTDYTEVADEIPSPPSRKPQVLSEGRP